jgi:hypothetical protein
MMVLFQMATINFISLASILDVEGLIETGTVMWQHYRLLLLVDWW